jgi:hypothetical protein
VVLVVRVKREVGGSESLEVAEEACCVRYDCDEQRLTYRLIHVTPSRALNQPCFTKRHAFQVSSVSRSGLDNEEGIGAGAAPDVKADSGLPYANAGCWCSSESSDVSCCSAALNSSPSASRPEEITVCTTADSINDSAFCRCFLDSNENTFPIANRLVAIDTGDVSL